VKKIDFLRSKNSNLSKHIKGNSIHNCDLKHAIYVVERGGAVIVTARPGHEKEI